MPDDVFVTTVPDEDGITYCQWHPQVETALRCYQCGAPICAQCAQRTPVGYLCRDCRRGRKQRFEQAKPSDYVVAGVVSLILGGLAGWFIPSIGWFVVFLSPLAGTLTAEIAWRLVGRRYGQHLWWIVAGGIVLGGLPRVLLALLFGIYSAANGSIWGIIDILWPIVHMAMAAGAASARLRLR
ncbi:MAG: hypothetical protein JXB35_11915 [Anaerolineae bacterium]|nr:hypothetical protein [Anaerolineae bacterium]